MQRSAAPVPELETHSVSRFTGSVQLALAVRAIMEVGRRTVMGSNPEPTTMFGGSLVALAVNSTCRALLRHHR